MDKILRLYVLPILAASIFLFTPVARATPLNLILFDSPDIMAGFIDVTYDAGDDLFVADGFALELDDDGVGDPFQIAGGTMNITATINDSGTLVSGTVTYGGTVSSLGYTSGTLLTGNLTAFGFGDAGDPFEFLFDVTGGSAQDLFGGIGSLAGLILSVTGFDGSFTLDFDNLIAGLPGTGSGVNNAGVPVSEPATMLLIGFGLIGLAGFSRKHKK